MFRISIIQLVLNQLYQYNAASYCDSLTLSPVTAVRVVRWPVSGAPGGGHPVSSDPLIVVIDIVPVIVIWKQVGWERKPVDSHKHYYIRN